MICYFSGTGNSLAVARKLSAILKDERIETFSWLRKTNGGLLKDEKVILVFPVYAFGLPLMVYHLLQEKVRVEAKQVYSVGTCGAIPGIAHYQIREAMTRQGQPYNGGFLVYEPEKFWGLWESKVAWIAQEMEFGRSSPPAASMLPIRWLSPAGHEDFRRRGPDYDKKFRAKKTCTKCGICQKVCPAENITLGTNGRPQWNHKCEVCLACLMYCPVKTIEFGRLSRLIPKWMFNRHPDVRWEDIARQKSEDRNHW